MVDKVMMYNKPQKYQQQQQQQQYQLLLHTQQQQKNHQQLKCKIKYPTKKHREKSAEGGDFYYTLSTSTKTNTTYNTATTTTCLTGIVGSFSVKYYRHVYGERKGSALYLWLVLVVFMLILCGNTAISQQRHINNNARQNNSNNTNNNIGNILLQISTPSSSSVQYTNSNNRHDRGAVVGNGVGVGIIVAADEVEKQVFTNATQRQQQQQQLPAKPNITTKTTTSTTSSSSSSFSSSSSSSSSSSPSSSSSSNNAPTLGISNSNSNINIYTTTTSHSSHNNLSSNNNESLLNGGESISATSGNNKNNSNNITDNNYNNNTDTKSSSEDLLNAAVILNESEDGNDHLNTVSSTTFRPVRSSITPLLTSAQERERRLMNVLAARRSALQRPGFRNRIGTTGRTATAVETTSKSPTDPRSICIRNCTKNFTRRTTASCMRQCANFSRVSSNTPGAASSTVVVKKSSNSGTGTAQAGERDTNEILFTDESSHGLLVIAKEQNDTLNHIPGENKGGTAAKLRGRRKQQSQVSTVTLATTSLEDDEIQPYLYFGQKLPPLKPNALTITSVSDEHPKILEVSVADVEPSSTTPVTLTSASTLSAVERSRARFKYNMRNGVSFNRRYTNINRSTTPEVPTELRTTTLRIVAEVVKEPKIKVLRSDLLDKIRDSTSPKPFAEALKDEQLFSASTPLIITVLSDEEMATPTPETGVIYTTKQEQMRMPTTLPTTTATQPTTQPSSTTTTSTTTTTRKPTTSTTAATTSTTAATTTTTTAATTSTTTPSTTTTTTIKIPKVYQQPISTSTATPTTSKTTTSTTTTSTTTTTPAPTAATTHKPIISDEDTELLRKLGPSLTQRINTDDKTNLIIFVNRTTDTYRPKNRLTSTTMKPQPETAAYIPLAATTDSSTTILHTTILTSIRSTINPRSKEMNHYFTTTPFPTTSSQKGPLQHSEMTPSSTTLQPVITGEISSTVVTDDQEISLEMQRMNVVTMVLAGIGIVPLLAIILYLLRNYLLKRPIKDDEDFDVCITDQQPISPVKKIDSKYQEEDEDEVDHHKKPPQRQHSLHSKLVSAPLARDNNHNVALNQQRYDDKSSVTSDQEFERSNIRLKSLLGEGNFGQVWKAEADDLSGHFGATRIVAVKTIKVCSTQLSLKDEANIMRKLGSHQNVVTLLGACVDSEPHMLIMEYAMRGRLLSLLRAARNATNILPASVPGGRSLTPLSPRTLAGFCLDIARGMEYIAEKRIVHRDLAARNVLLDHNGVCKICDFGMSIDLDAERKRKELEKNCANEIMRSNFNKFKFDFGGKFIINHWTQSPTKDSNEKKSHGRDTIGKRPALPIRWMAPEALQYNIFSTETDIWAFGIVLWEIATLGSTPYSHITGREVIRRVPQGLRPDLPKEGRHEFYNLMSRCWHKDPQMRPSLSQCRLEISRSLHKWVDDDSAASDYMDVSGFSEDLEQGMVYFNHRISEFECEI